MWIQKSHLTTGSPRIRHIVCRSRKCSQRKRCFGSWVGLQRSTAADWRDQQRKLLMRVPRCICRIVQCDTSLALGRSSSTCSSRLRAWLTLWISRCSSAERETNLKRFSSRGPVTYRATVSVPGTAFDIISEQINQVACLRLVLLDTVQGAKHALGRLPASSLLACSCLPSRQRQRLRFSPLAVVVVAAYAGLGFFAECGGICSSILSRIEY